jgi:release factor glutamine methyltransferase
MKVFEAIDKGLELLGKDRYLETLLILEKVTGLKKENILSSYELELPSSIEKDFLKIVSKRKKNFPLQYILGKVEFWSMEFKIERGVFIPRPETELIVEKIVNFANGKELTIADIGTGCGNIAISLSIELPRSTIFATDISSKAIELARQNARIHGVEERIIFLKGSLFEPFKNLSLKRSFDIICSNPPYIPEVKKEYLPKEVSEFEPNRALFSGRDGLNFIRKFIKSAPIYLREKGRVYIEIGEGMEEDVLSLFKGWSFKEVYKDLHNKPRVVMAQL